MKNKYTPSVLARICAGETIYVSLNTDGEYKVIIERLNGYFNEYTYVPPTENVARLALNSEYLMAVRIY